MSQKEKLIAKLRSKPKDLTFDEVEQLLGYLSYRRSDQGKTCDSRVAFLSDGHATIFLHEPYPRKELLGYQVKQLLDILEQEGLL